MVVLSARGLCRAAKAIAWATAVSGAPASADEKFDIAAYDVVGNTLLDQATIERAVYGGLGPGQTAADVEKSRATLEAAYRARGYESVSVDLPPQREIDGIVTIKVTEARLGTVKVTGSRYSSDTRLRRQLPSLAAGEVPDLKAAQREIADVNRLADRQVTPLIKPGKVPGTIDIELKVRDKFPLHARVELNNDHNPNTDPLRLVGTIRYADLWHLGHSVSFTYIVAPQNRANAEVYSGSYLAPIWGSQWSLLLFGYKSNSTVPSLGGTSVLGNGYDIGLRAIRQIGGGAGWQQSISFGADYKNFNELIRLGTTTLEAPIRYVPATFSYSVSHSNDRATASLTTAVTAGIRRIGTPDAIFAPGSTTNIIGGFASRRFGALGNFVHFNAEAEYRRNLGSDIVADVRLAGQLADQPLVSSEQFVSGGLGTVRGYLQSEAVGDDGGFGSIELRSPSATFLGSFVDDWRLFVFADGAYARIRQPQTGQTDSYTLLSVGAGTRFQFFRYVSGEAVFGHVLRGATTSREGDNRATFRVKAEF